jgi:hypothetical protein
VADECRQPIEKQVHRAWPGALGSCQRRKGDLPTSAKIALATVDPTPYFAKYGAVGNMWGAVKAYLNAVGEATAAPVIEKYTGVLAAADVFTPDVAFWLMESIRLNRGIGLQVHP